MLCIAARVAAQQHKTALCLRQPDDFEGDILLSGSQTQHGSEVVDDNLETSCAGITDKPQSTVADRSASHAMPYRSPLNNSLRS